MPSGRRSKPPRLGTSGSPLVATVTVSVEMICNELARPARASSGSVDINC
ncbi:hypothetical protein Q7514_00805 [Rhodococcus artemisiae]|uniref:Uncharacterized protein n=1 Tax=Rhodococcus artemisiae TaxID=714159 RepID=A0ABU7L586_9NOCA|nr:hypothetical protein [Rhodococcus artemisiae]MEE2056067.1 hypothetical protein [Rhodococcus artemisiae]